MLGCYLFCLGSVGFLTRRLSITAITITIKTQPQPRPPLSRSTHSPRYTAKTQPQQVPTSA